MSLRYSFFLIPAIITSVYACDIHHNYASHPHLGRRQHVRRADDHGEIDWDYARSFDWGTIRPEYATCRTGTTQSPINLNTAQGLSINHIPDLGGYAAQPEASGNLFNWGFGPAYTLHHEGEDFSTLPAMKFDDQTLFFSGWHMHFPSEHLIDGVRAPAEVHMVHVDATGAAKSVIGLRLEASHDGHVKSAFFDSLPGLIQFNDTTEVEGVMMDPMLPINEVGGMTGFWTYRGSLTTPPCTEGLRWFVGKQTLKVSQEQMVNLLGVSRFSHRLAQRVWMHEINV